MTATEKYVRYAAAVDTLAQAWALIMEHLDEFAEPRIEIQHKRSRSDTEEETTVTVEVSIGGLVTT